MKKISKKSQKENVDYLISIAKDEYEVFFKRNQILDTKVGIIITIMGAICSFTLDIDYLNVLIHNLTIYNYPELLLYIGLIGILMAMVILTMCIILPRNTCFMPLTIFNEQLYENVDNDELKKRILMSSYKSLLNSNNQLLRTKNRQFNAICILSMIDMGIVIILQIFKIVV